MKIYRIARQTLYDGWILSSGEIIYCGSMQHEQTIKNNLTRFGITNEEWKNKVENFQSYNPDIPDTQDATYILAFEHGAVRFSLLEGVMGFVTGTNKDVKRNIETLHKMCKNNSIRRVRMVSFNTPFDYFRSSSRDVAIENLYNL